MVTLFHELRERLLRAGIAPRHVRRYLTELREHCSDLAAEEERAGRNRKEAESAALARLGNTDDLAQAMIHQPQLRPWCARAPWAVFSASPLILLGAAYLFACCYLWLGWTIFLPHADTPFGMRNSGSIYSFSNLYFQAGKYFYLFAPIFVGWCASVLSARQRMNGAWLALSVGLIAWMGSTARIQASRTAVPRGLGHISMSFFSRPQSGETAVLGYLLIFSFSLLPYLIWRVQARHSTV